MKPKGGPDEVPDEIPDHPDKDVDL